MRQAAAASTFTAACGNEIREIPSAQLLAVGMTSAPSSLKGFSGSAVSDHTTKGDKTSETTELPHIDDGAVPSRSSIVVFAPVPRGAPDYTVADRDAADGSAARARARGAFAGAQR